MKNYNIAIIGTGNIAGAMAEAINTHPHTSAHAVFSRREETGCSFASQYGIPHVYTDLDSLLNDQDTDIVYIASPNSLHYPYAKKAILHHKHVILEKPFTSNRKEAEELFFLAKENDVFLFEAIVTPHSANYRLLQKKVSEIGKIRYGHITCGKRSSRMDALLEGKEPNTFSPAFSGGSVMDLGVYDIHFVLGLFGRPEEVNYDAKKYGNGIDLSGTLFLKYPGTDIQCYACKDSDVNEACILIGEKGRIVLRQGCNARKDFTVYTDEKAIHYDIRNGISRMDEELRDFIDIIDRNDHEAEEELSRKTLEVMDILDKARKDADIVFPADQKEKESIDLLFHYLFLASSSIPPISG